MELQRGVVRSIWCLLGVALLATTACKQVAPGEEDDNEPITAAGCGVERWSVKTGTDALAAQVNMTPQDTTIAAMRALPVPAGLASGSGRFAGTAEMQNWRLSNVTLVEYKLESDSDYHLVLKDASGNTMIAEISAPTCVSGGTWGPAITAARNAFNAKYTPSGSFQTANVPVTITGVGFFDLQHGQTGVAPNAIEIHSVQTICFPGSTVSACATTSDFSLAASPASLSTAPGGTSSSTISVTGSNGFAGNVSLSAAGLPSGASASFSASSVPAGGTSTLTLSAGSAAAGTYTVTVTGTSGALSHPATIAWTITGGTTGGALTNGDFEAGSLSGWTATGQTAVVSSGAHGGTYAARVGSTSASTDSSITQQVTLPSGSPTLSFWYKVVCPDTITYDWASVQVKSTSGAVLATPLANTCSNSGNWVQATASLSQWAGQTVVLSFNNHDDNYASDPTYTLYDDISISGSTATPDFTLSASPTSVSTAAGASGTATIAVGALNGFTGNVSLAVAGAPTGASATLSPTSVTGSGSSVLTLSAGSAAAGTYNVTVTGTSGALSHPAAVTWTIGGSTTGGALTNGDFEAGSLSGWTATGQTAVVSSGAHGGTYAARVGSTSASTDSAITQQVALPSGSPTLSFWYKIVCPDSITYDWASVQVKSTAGAVLATPLANTCSNSGSWVQATASLSQWAGQTVVLSFNNHDDNYASDPTYTLYDDITISGSTATPDFTLSLSASAVSSADAANATATASIAPANGFNSAVSLSVTGVPSGASVSFNPTSVASGSGSSTLTLSPGTAAAGTYGLTVTATGGGLTHTAPLSWTLSTATATLQTVFIILLENHNWSSIKGSASAPYINGTLLTQGAHAEAYNNVPGLHPSLPNYLWLEAGTNFGITADGVPSQFHQSTSQHLVTLLQNAGITWKAYQEAITGSTCPLTASGLYAPKHIPMVFFDDVTNTNNSASANCISHVRPYSELATDLSNNTVARYNFITPDLCDDMHNSTGCATTDEVKNGDTWLANNLPQILASAAYRNNGAVFITWDESEGSDVPIGMIVLSPKARPGYSNTIAYTHSSTLRTMQTIFGVGPMLGDAANATDLRDLFTSFP
jgi:hypothetical protein